MDAGERVDGLATDSAEGGGGGGGSCVESAVVLDSCESDFNAGSDTGMGTIPQDTNELE